MIINRFNATWAFILMVGLVASNASSFDLLATLKSINTLLEDTNAPVSRQGLPNRRISGGGR